MNAKHTPGPWEFLEEGRTEEIYNRGHPLTIGGGPAHDDIANVFSHSDATVGISRDEAIANARLIAAAPEMWDAIADADGCFEAALCEGWLEALADGDIERIRDLWVRRLSHARNQFPAAIAKAGAV